MNTMSKENFRLEKEEELSPAVKSLIGIAKPSGNEEDSMEEILEWSFSLKNMDYEKKFFLIQTSL